MPRSGIETHCAFEAQGVATEGLDHTDDLIVGRLRRSGFQQEHVDLEGFTHPDTQRGIGE